MSFRKPFRAVPIKVGPYYRRRARREQMRGGGAILAQAAALGVMLAIASVVVERPARSLWRTLTDDRGETALRENSVYYSGCDAARQAGAAPIYASEPGYRSEMDGDSDGIACEPYYR